MESVLFLRRLLVGQFILSGIEHTPEQLKQMSPQQLTQYLDFEAGAVKIPYLIIAGVVLLVSILFFITRIPEIKEEDAERGNKNVFDENFPA